MKFLSLDSKFTQIMTSVGEMMLLNACWIIGCLPLITIRASNAALYTVLLRRLRGEGSGTIVPFFKAWWENLKMGTLFWVAQVFITGSLGLILFLTLPVFLKVIAVILLILVSLVFSVIYPQLARFRNRWFAYVRNSLILMITRFRWVLLNLALFLSPVLLFLLVPVEFLQFGFVWILIGFSVLFFLSSEIMQKVLQPMEEMAAERK